MRRLSGERDLLDGPLILMIKVVAKENGLPGFAFGVANQKEGLNLYSLGMHNYDALGPFRLVEDVHHSHSEGKVVISRSFLTLVCHPNY